MELEDLKTDWNILNERLQQNEILNKRIIKEMIANRTNSARYRLYRYDIFSIIIVSVVGFIIPLMAKHTAIHLSSLIMLEATLLFALVMEIYRFFFLLRFDIEARNLSELLRFAAKYKRLIKWNHTYGTLLGILVVVVFFILERGNLSREVERYIFAGVFVLLTAIAGYIQVRFYRSNISTMEKGLKELERLEEE